MCAVTDHPANTPFWVDACHSSVCFRLSFLLAISVTLHLAIQRLPVRPSMMAKGAKIVWLDLTCPPPSPPHQVDFTTLSCLLLFVSSQNEVDYEDAVKLVAKGVKIVLEGANMPSTPDAIHHFNKTSVVLAAAKACNAGGVAVSGLEMAQNAGMTTWTHEVVDGRLKVRM